MRDAIIIKEWCENNNWPPVESSIFYEYKEEYEIYEQLYELHTEANTNNIIRKLNGLPSIEVEREKELETFFI